MSERKLRRLTHVILHLSLWPFGILILLGLLTLRQETAFWAARQEREAIRQDQLNQLVPRYTELVRKLRAYEIEGLTVTDPAKKVGVVKGYLAVGADLFPAAKLIHMTNALLDSFMLKKQEDGRLAALEESMTEDTEKELRSEEQEARVTDTVQTNKTKTVTKSSVAIPSPTPSFSIARIKELTNNERKSKGLPPLESNTKLNKATEARLKDMLAKQYFSHTSPDGKGISYFIEAAGYTWAAIGENLAYGNYENETQIVTGLMESPGHKANILSANFKEIGVAVGRGQFLGKEYWVAVQMFGTP